MYLGFSAIALLSLYGNFKGLRLLLDSRKFNLGFVTFVTIFFVFGFARMALVTGFAGTEKEKAFRSWANQTAKTQSQQSTTH